MNSIIYRIRCTVNGKYYIGSTVNKNQRWARHRKDLRDGKHKNKNMQASWDKYGEGSFVFEVLEEVADALQLMAVEQRYLDQCVGAADCFNHNKFADAPWRGRSGAETPRYGKPVPEEVRVKISQSLSGEKHPNWGKTPSPETRAKLVAANKAYPHHEYRHTAEALAKISATSKSRTHSKETRAKMSASKQGHEVTSLTRVKISKTLSGDGNFWYGKKRPEHGAKVSKAIEVVLPDGTITRYDSITALREATGLKAPTVNRALKSGVTITRGKFTGWLFRYAGQTFKTAI